MFWSRHGANKTNWTKYQRVLDKMTQVSSHCTVLEKTVGSNITSSSDLQRELRLAFLGCEETPPYGPSEYTATLFLDLITSALERCLRTIDKLETKTSWKISITVYKVKEGHFPKNQDEYDSYNGFIIPGSLSSAYDDEEWIHNLRNVIQTELIKMARPTLGVCFGHQVFAHSYDAGNAIKCPAGFQVGRKGSSPTKAGRQLLGLEDTLDLFYTHGDMVCKLPNEGVCLSGNDNVPIQSVAYFKTANEANSFKNNCNCDNEIPKPIAITCQAHPEYVSGRPGPEGLLSICLDLILSLGFLSAEGRRVVGEDAEEKFLSVQEQTLNLTIAVGQKLGWFPQRKKL